MTQINPATAPADTDTRIQWAALHRAGYLPKPDLPFLISSLKNPDVAIWSYTQRILRRIFPMAALYERWPSTADGRQMVDLRLPEWIRTRCREWGADHDFSAICADQLTTAGDGSVQKRLMRRLAPFYGAQRAITARLTAGGHAELAARFADTAHAFNEKQFPKQLTIIPTMACQLQCRYCYSAGIPQTEFNTMVWKDLNQLLDWARTGGISRICLAGGEPTIYPHLGAFLDYVADNDMTYFLSTNGLYTQEVAERLLANRPLSVSLHINPEIYRTKRRQLFIDNTRVLVNSGIMTALRFNLVSSTSDEYYDYLDLCEQIGVRQIRLAVPVPNFSRSNTFVNLSADELKTYASYIDRFVAASRARRIEIHLSKPFPLCLLAEETAAIFLENGSYNACCQVHLQCGTHNLTVYPDMRFSPCLSLNQQSDKPIMEYKDIFQAATTYAGAMNHLSDIPLMDQCRACPLADGGRCVGACLSYRVNTNAHPYSANNLM